MMCARLFTKGAAEQILELCTRRVRDDSGVALLGPEEKQQLLDSFSEDGNRSCHCFTVALACLSSGMLHFCHRHQVRLQQQGSFWRAVSAGCALSGDI